MNDWTNDDKARRRATVAFCKYLHDDKNAKKRADCKENGEKAKRLFAKLGSFYVEGDKRKAGDEQVAAIPSATKFYVFEEDERQKADSVVTLVLPSERKELPIEAKLVEAYRCTWISWSSVDTRGI